MWCLPVVLSIFLLVQKTVKSRANLRLPFHFRCSIGGGRGFFTSPLLCVSSLLCIVGKDAPLDYPGHRPVASVKMFDLMNGWFRVLRCRRPSFLLCYSFRDEIFGVETRDRFINPRPNAGGVSCKPVNGSLDVIFGTKEPSLLISLTVGLLKQSSEEPYIKTRDPFSIRVTT